MYSACGSFHARRYSPARLVLLPNPPDSGKIEGTRSLALLCVFSYPQHANEWPIFQVPPDFFPPVSGVLPRVAVASEKGGPPIELSKFHPFNSKIYNQEVRMTMKCVQC